MPLKFRPQLLLTAFVAIFAIMLSLSSIADAQARPFTGDLFAKNTPTSTPKKASATPDPRFVDSGAINDGDSVSEDVDDDHVYFIYTYDGKQDDELTLEMTVKNGLIPYLGVSTSDQKDILDEKVGKKGDKAATLTATLPEDGTYLILIGRADGTKGSSSGTFTVNFSVQAGSGGGSSTPTVEPIDPTGDASDVIDRLHTAGLVPEGGKQLISINDSFGTTSDVGSDFLRMGRGAQAQDMVLSYIVGWATAGTTSSCGMAFRITNTDYTSVSLSNDSHIIAYQTDGKNDPLFSYDQEATLFDFDKGNIVTVIAIGDKVTVFVNGKFVTEETGKAAKGVFAIQVFNPKGNKVTTDCRYANIWVWSFK